jgi:hypothetical protein
MEVLIKIAADKGSTNRDRIQAIKALLAADSANVEAERLALEQQREEFELGEGRDRIAAILVGLRANGSDSPINGTGAISDTESVDQSNQSEGSNDGE